MAARGRLLLGAFDTVTAAVEYSSQLCVVSPERIRETWNATRDQYLNRQTSRTSAIGELSEESWRAAMERMQAPLLQASLKGKRWRIGSVAVESLLVAQPLIDLDRTRVMASKLADGVVPTFFPTETAIEVSAEARDGPAIALMAPRSELAITHAEIKRPTATGAIEVVFRVEPRPNYVTVLEANGALVVRNGIHRLYAAWEAGLRDVPCVLVEGDVAELVGDRWDRLPVRTICGDSPPRLVDFTVREVCVEVPLRRRRFETVVRAEHAAINLDT